MDDVIRAIEQRRAALLTELASLDAARAALSPSPHPAEPSAKKPAGAPTEQSASQVAPKNRPGHPRRDSSQPNPQSQPLTLKEARDRVRALLEANGSMTTKELMAAGKLSSWQVAKAVAGWGEVTHTDPNNIRSPYCLNPAVGPTV